MKLTEAIEIHQKCSSTYKKALISMELNEKRIRLTDWLLLNHLNEVADGMSITEIVEHKMQCDLGLKKYTDKEKNNFKVKISKRIKRYVEIGMIETVQDPKDKRTRRIFMTDSCKKMLQEVEQRAESIWRKEQNVE
ncbi:MarR family transcriptional regulator [Mycoplasma marinum]|uniref:HTH marR-type domain-containing protein n=1 Tax=Mycoplasma marinum TaxID=1937190 RepID=A0A4R0XML4_9MOLU|nr:helix-turn-helix domain-containing protein [Mycoplasma marinum]TCG11777.1 hypothetical protein C4B24_01340 [Mycoplasma marinum]